MAEHDIEITISRTGEVKVHIKGAKGKSCLEYAKWLSQVVGRVESQQLTSEYYEPDVKAGMRINQEVRRKERQ